MGFAKRLAILVFTGSCTGSSCRMAFVASLYPTPQVNCRSCAREARRAAPRRATEGRMHSTAIASTRSCCANAILAVTEIAAGPRSQLLLLAGKSRAMRAKLYASCPNGRRSSGIHRQPDQRLTRFVVTSRPRSTSSRVCRGCFVAHIHMWSRQAAVILARRRSGHPLDGGKLETRPGSLLFAKATHSDPS